MDERMTDTDKRMTHLSVAVASDFGTESEFGDGDDPSDSRPLFVDAETLSPSKRGFGPRVYYSLAYPTDADCKSVRDLIDDLRDVLELKQRSAIRQILHDKMLPGRSLSVFDNVGDLALLLSADDKSVQCRASSILEKLLLELVPSKDSNVSKKLLQVGHITQVSFLSPKEVVEKRTLRRQEEPSENSQRRAVFGVSRRSLRTKEALTSKTIPVSQDREEEERQKLMVAYHHLMAVAALLSRCFPLPDWKACSFLIQPTKGRGWSYSESVNLNDILQTAMELFYKTFKEQLERTRPFPVLAREDWSTAGREKRKEYYARATVSEKIVYAFALLNEIYQQSWTEISGILLEALRDLRQTQPFDDQDDSLKHFRIFFDFFLVRGLAALLRNIFQADIAEVGARRCDHTILITNLILDVVKCAEKVLKNHLLQEVSDLVFHNADSVRRVLNCWLRAEGPPMSDLTLSCLEERLRIIGFQRAHVTASNDCRHARDHECKWVEFMGTICEKSAEGAVFVQKASHLANRKVYRCVNGCALLRSRNNSEITGTFHTSDAASASEKTKRLSHTAHHNKNFDMLRLLGSASHVRQLWAYQIKPFPFYVAESVEDRRLIGFLLDHRSEEIWLTSPALITVSLNVLEALLYLKEKRAVNCDVTTFNLIVGNVGESQQYRQGSRTYILPSSAFSVKMADLGLTFQLKDGEDHVHLDTDTHPIPVRWTAPEALFDGSHSERSMVYSFGCVLYELWTLGCQPFTKYGGDSETPRILCETVPPNETRLHRWPCIPDNAYSLIGRCTEPIVAKRPSLRDVKEEMATFICNAEEGDRKLPDRVSQELLTSNKREKYPEICKSQNDRKQNPERGTDVRFERIPSTQPLYEQIIQKCTRL